MGRERQVQVQVLLQAVNLLQALGVGWEPVEVLKLESLPVAREPALLVAVEPALAGGWRLAAGGPMVAVEPTARCLESAQPGALEPGGVARGALEPGGVARGALEQRAQGPALPGAAEGPAAQDAEG